MTKQAPIKLLPPFSPLN